LQNLRPQNSASLSQAFGKVLKAQAAARARKLPPDSIHDLRVALRRSRSLAEGVFRTGYVRGLAPNCEKPASRCRTNWRSCANLQGCTKEWIRKLGIQGDGGGADLANSFRGRKSGRATGPARR